MKKSATEEMIRKNITLSVSCEARLNAIRAYRASTSDSEVIRQAITLMEYLLKGGHEVILRDAQTGKDKVVAFL